jgi:ribonuclease-3
VPANHAHDWRELQQCLGHTFAHPGLLQQALRHVSVFGAPSYQRLEFLGDALLDLAVSGWLLQQTAAELAATNSR